LENIIDHLSGLLFLFISVFVGIVIHETAHVLLFFATTLISSGRKVAVNVLGQTRLGVEIALYSFRIHLRTPDWSRGKKLGERTALHLNQAIALLAGPLSHIIFSLTLIYLFERWWSAIFAMLWCSLGLINMSLSNLSLKTLTRRGANDGEQIALLIAFTNGRLAPRYLVPFQFYVPIENIVSERQNHWSKYWQNLYEHRSMTTLQCIAITTTYYATCIGLLATFTYSLIQLLEMFLT
jgi:hypothetical protein